MQKTLQITPATTNNQPFFHPNKALVYFASANDDGRTDIVSFNYKTKELLRITNTSEREYSPTVTPDGRFISCIIQRDDGKQDLGKYPVEGGIPQVIIDNLTVGYHAWADDNNVFIFVLGEPVTLRWYSVADKKDIVTFDSIGRSIHRIPGSKSISFVDKSKPDKWLIRKVNGSAGTISAICETLPGREDLAWISSEFILMSDGQKIFYLKPGKNQQWKEVENQSTVAFKSITRLAVSADGSKLAVVVSE